MKGDIILFLFFVLLVINIATVAAFRSDKRRAVAGQRRISEANLLQLAMLGGSPGALLARRLFRHKTRKEPFSTRLLLIVAIQAGAVIGLLIV
ncbi:DUF1294 domain-containing protein [Sphingomonas sp.]|jgi:uncharacterized membrane protein YsdA (DUF1294 family)|uniref:DUF1294 domain-containing protein n=1 Tax=Sphingomonas sp. TaxID=28214 RepID=UPI00261CA8B0|nr:DUF1294 domain-containing protein [Sphingomonas sp.]MDF2493406.1 cold-shock protein [Sphingomonas sp.]